jgi:hypothetical protein
MPESYSVNQRDFMGQTTAYDAGLIKSNVLVMGSCELNAEARYIHGRKGRYVYFYGGHDPGIFNTKLVIHLLFWIYIQILLDTA